MSKLTFEGINSTPAWTPDAQSLIYISIPTTDPNVVGQLFRVRADGTGAPEPLLTDPRGVASVVVSHRDGWVVLGTSPNVAGAGDLLAFRPGIDTAMIPLLESPTGEGEPSLSPDGRWLAYSSFESGRRQVYIRPFPAVNEGKWQVSLDGGFLPRWANSGAELFYLNLRGGFMAAEIQTTPTLSVGRRQVLYSSAIRGYDVAPDDQRFFRLWSQPGADSVGTQLVLVQGFLSELEAKGSR